MENVFNQSIWGDEGFSAILSMKSLPEIIKIIKEVGIHHYPRVAGRPTGNNLKVVKKQLTDLFSFWWKCRTGKIKL